jgi:hypothetical protein
MADLSTSTWEKDLASSEGGVSFFENMIVRMLLIAACLPILLSLALLAYFIHPSETPIVLHYNVYFGVDLLGIWWQVYILPFLGTLFFLGHFFLARRFYIGAERIACYLMLLSSGMLSLGIFIASLSVAVINY